MVIARVILVNINWRAKLMTEIKFLETYDNINGSFLSEDLEYAIDHFEIVQENSESAGDMSTTEYATTVKVKDRFFEIIWDRFFDRFDFTYRRTFYTGDVDEVFPHVVAKVVYY